MFLGAAVPISGPVTPGNTHWFWPDVPRYEFSRDKALALLSGIGLANRDQDPWLEDAKGTEARFTLLTFRGNSVLERGAAVVGDALRQVGIAVDVVPLETNAVRQRVVGGDFEAALIQFTATDPDPAHVARISGSAREARTSGIPVRRRRRPTGSGRSTT